MFISNYDGKKYCEHNQLTVMSRCLCPLHSSQVASMRGVSRPVAKLPTNNQPPQVMLSKELVSPADIRFVSNSCVFFSFPRLSATLHRGCVLSHSQAFLCSATSNFMYMYILYTWIKKYINPYFNFTISNQ